MKTRSELEAEVLRRITQAVSTLTDEQLDNLLRTGVNIVVADPAVEPARKVRSRSNELRSEEVEEIRQMLEALPTREDGTKLLEARCQSKEQLQQLLRALELPVRKDDNRAKLLVSIVEATIGFRLRSQAVQGVESAR